MTPVLFAADNLSLTHLLPRLFISMAVVIAVMWMAARIMKNRQVPGGSGLRLTSTKRAPIVQVMARQAVGRNASVTVVRLGDKALVLGVTETNVSLISEIDSIDLETLESHGTGTPVDVISTTSGTARKGLLEQVRELTVRKA